LHIDIEERNSFLALNLRDLRLSCTVEVCVDLTVLNEHVPSDHLLEIRTLNKVVMDAIDFTWARFTRSI